MALIGRTAMSGDSKTLGLEIDFIVPELTMTPHNPTTSELIPLSGASRAKAFDDAVVKARSLAERLAA
ncbi:hypothetical protein PV726_08710 [Streptomyces europaeiscabiei]|nr:hypothetical protein [Streptomyces europaeiscabiei]MDX3690402.1 hypothetical protein [Streptomyces europaeiscabiei]